MKSINLDVIFDILQRGVRRAGTFTGIGLNASDHSHSLSYELTIEGPYFIEFTKPNLSDHDHAHIMQEFAKWIRANGLRELIETFSIYMHELYTAIYSLLEHLHQLDDLAKHNPKKFERKGIREQIELLSKVISVSEGDIKIIRSLNGARNCYAHRRGLIGRQDIGPQSDNFQLIWKGLQIEAEEPDGNIVVESDIFDRVFENGADIQFRNLQKEKRLKIGEELLIANRREFAEIYLCVFEIGKRLHQATISFVQEKAALHEKDADRSTTA